jgi:D-3-phosphoglycerate dehydrogenase
VPNVVSHVTSFVAQKNINIDSMVNKSRGEYAYSVLDLDGTPTEETIDDVRKLDTVFGVRAIL